MQEEARLVYFSSWKISQMTYPHQFLAINPDLALAPLWPQYQHKHRMLSLQTHNCRYTQEA